ALRVLPQLPCEARVAEQLANSKRHPLDAVDEIARAAVDDLAPDASDRAADHRSALPHRLGDRQPAPLLQRLLHHHRRGALERVDPARSAALHDQRVDVGISGGLLTYFVEHLRTLRIIAHLSADEDELARMTAGCQLEATDDADGILEPV